MAKRRFRAKDTQAVIVDSLVAGTGSIANELAADLAEANVGIIQQNPQLLQPGMAAVGLAGQFFSQGQKPGQKAMKNFFLGWTADAIKESVRSFTPLLSGLGQAAFMKKPGAQAQMPSASDMGVPV